MPVDPELLRACAEQVDAATAAMSGIKNQDPRQGHADRFPLGLPAQMMLTSSMRTEPVPGWKASSRELGLPPGTIPKIVGNVGDHGYILGITGTGWWLVGIDVATGRRAFAPVELS